MPDERTLTNQGRSLGLIILPLAVLLLIYLPALRDLVVDWYTDDNYSHGFLIPIVSGWLLWRKREQLKATPRYIDPLGLVFVIAGAMMFVVSNGAAEYASLRFSFILTLFGLVFYLFGRSTVKASWFELAFLVFMIPIPYVIYYAATFPLQILSSKITVAILHLMGAGAVRSGNIIHIAGTSLEVAEACSGLRSLISLLALGALYAYLVQMRPVGRAILFLSSIPIAIAANVIRVLVTSILAYAVTMDVTAEPTHSIMGTLVFIVAFVMLFFEAAVLRRIFR